ncbi:uncharacterized protein LOC134232925 [Saccostrea cucullata]|uniref:uncharacterized protein LOC134232925 n=1 Tax=Saccostrea cuccullata TaxID=36930 RepID=UPI002ED22454
MYLQTAWLSAQNIILSLTDFFFLPVFSMSSAVYACWLCPDKFKSNRDRKNHLISRPHERMRVICPFCPVRDGKREKTLRRMADLKVHVLEAHKGLGRLKDVPSDFYSEANGFWFSVHPSDYRKIVQPNPWKSEAAIRARLEIVSWVRSNSLSSRKLREFEQGWEEGRGSSLTPEEHFRPDYIEETEEDHSPVMKKPRGYSPTKPELDDRYTIKAISLEGGLIRVHVASEEDKVFNIKMTSEASRNPQILSSVMRKSQSIHPDPFFQIPTFFSPISSPILLKEMSKLLGVDEKLIESIRKGASPPPYVPSKPSACFVPEPQMEISTTEAASAPVSASGDGPLIAIPIGTIEQDADSPPDATKPLVDSTPLLLRRLSHLFLLRPWNL